MSLLLGLLVLAGCEADEEREYRGHLYFSQGAYLGRLDLRDGSIDIVANLGDTVIHEVDDFGEEQLLLSVYGPVNNKDAFRLMQYELGSGGLATLINGRHGRYLPVPEALIYDEGAYLKVRLYGGKAMEEVTVTQHRFAAAASIIKVSDTEILYSVGPDSAIFLFDVESGVSEALSGLSAQCSLEGALWIYKVSALLCKRGGEDPGFAFISLDGETREALAIPDAGPFRAVAYLDDQEALVLTEAWKTLVSGSTRHAVWIYDLNDNYMLRLVKDQNVGESVIYRPN